MFRSLCCAVFLTAVMVTAPAVGQPQNSATVGIDRVRAQLASRSRVSVIVELNQADPTAARSTLRAAEAATGLGRRLARVGVTAVRPVGSLPFVALEVDASQLEALVATGAVVSVGVDNGAKLTLAESVPLIRAPQARASGATGAGQVVVIVDTGVDRTHPFLSGKVVRGICSAPSCGNSVVDRVGAGDACKGPDCEHGTHVAGIAAGRGARFSGVASAASIISVRVFDGNSTSWEAVLRGLDYVLTELAPRYAIASVNMSLGGGSYGSDCDASGTIEAAFATVINGLRSRGIATVVSSGNDASKNSISLPACIHNAISVGGTTKSDGMYWYSNSASMLDLLAPGEAIRSSVPGGGYATFSGTSMAAPHVAGAIAALKSKVSGATVDQIEAALESTGVRIRDPRSSLTRPRIDVLAALSALSGDSRGWQAWASVGGSVVGRPECIVTGSGQIDCVVNTPGFKLAWNRWTNAGWRGWTDLGGAIGSSASCLTRDTQLHCFAIGLNKRLQENVYDGRGWSGWIERSTAALATGRPSCIAWSTQGIRCYTVSTASALTEYSYSGSAWSAHKSLGAVQGQPFCLNRASGIDCLALLATNKIGWRRFDGRTWTAWKNIGTATLATSPSCLVRGTTLHCFAPKSGSSGGPLMTSRLTGTSWSAWSSLGGNVKEQPSCIAFGSSDIECFAQTMGNTLWRKSYGGSSWAVGQDLGKSLGSTCVSPSSGRIDCFAAGTDTILKRISYY